jgi:hypothetical protein
MKQTTWIITVFKCDAKKVQSVLIDFYDFVCDLTEVKTSHFIIRDRLENDVVFSFRVSCFKEDEKIVKSKIAFKINNLVSKENYVINPDSNDPLFRYVAWSSEEAIKLRGEEEFNKFCSFLEKMSKLVIEMVKQNYFSSDERTEIAHAMCWMLGCNECFMLSTKNSKAIASLGYYDRIEDKYVEYLQRSFQQKNNNKKDKNK